ncbi:hypothetical protein J8273_7854 [Carpediemonas membranifera]|uniref:Uncharacterized protein n=1 Tax=Carpediemonas membranifera TaxID=201153 RepID=A0A8J6DZB9_9EUKA|nr:hypothetical protein J8273_7854 [Carpediemonas membranifera]|eukprot:KAG9390503.1 hypothetical protein J8273_7854 [Carpediemonas membranifera]
MISVLTTIFTIIAVIWAYITLTMLILGVSIPMFVISIYTPRLKYTSVPLGFFVIMISPLFGGHFVLLAGVALVAVGLLQAHSRQGVLPNSSALLSQPSNAMPSAPPEYHVRAYGHGGLYPRRSTAAFDYTAKAPTVRTGSPPHALHGGYSNMAPLEYSRHAQQTTPAYQPMVQPGALE